jgi:beta-N-acetylhexosaminidase
VKDFRHSAGLRRLAASVLCVGFEGATPEDAPLEALADLAPGGVVLFARNVRDVASTRILVDAATAAIGGDVPAFVAIDQEGGRVTRLRAGAAQMPAMMALGASGDAELARRVGLATANDLRRAGCTVNFAPSADLALEPASAVIGARALGDDPASVGSLVAALVSGLQAGGVAATLKHFPGHGATAADSHVALPVVEVSAATLRARDLVPFARGIAAGAKAVMTAHVLVRALDADRPATISRAVLTDLLRGELGFTGACFTDCMEMDAIANGVGTVRGAVAALAAGADCVLISHRLEIARAVRDGIAQAVSSGELALSRLEEAARRVAALRAWKAPAPPAIDGAAVAREVARRAVTRVRGSLRLDASIPVTVVSFEGATAEGAQGRHTDHASLNMALRTRRFRCEVFRAPLEPESEMLEHLVDLVRAQAGRQFLFLSRRAHCYPAQRLAVQALLDVAPDALLVSVREPFDAMSFSQARNVACTYGDEEVSIDALAEAIAGRIEAQGVMPVHFRSFV